MGLQADIEIALEGAKRQYALAHPNSAQAHASATRHLPGGSTRSTLHVDPFPLCFAKAKDATLTDCDGLVYDDFLCEYTAGIFGHSDARLRFTLQSQSEGGLNFGGHTSHEEKLARVLTNRFPALQLVRFTNSGTEANLVALGAARQFTGRDKIMVFSGAYHGGVLNFSAPSRVNAPFDVVVCQYNDVLSARRLLHAHRDELAAVIVEPMLQSSGCIPATDAFLRTLREESLAAGALLIFDEVVTSRLHPQGVHGKLGLAPDLVTLGKYVGGGLSFGAVGGHRAIMQLFDPRKADFVRLGGTFNNNALTMALGYTAMAEVFTPDAAIELNERGDRLRQELNGVCRAASVRMQFTGMGSIMTAHMTDGAIASAEDAAHGGLALRQLFYFYLLDRGLYIAPRGMVSLSLATTDRQINNLYEGVSGFISAHGQLLCT